MKKLFYNLIVYLYTLLIFSITLVLYISILLISFISRTLFKNDIYISLYNKIEIFSKNTNIFNKNSINILSLIEVSTRYLKVKKVRTIVTVSGMSIGIGGVVLLISLGYGFQDLINNKVASYQQLKQADVITPVDGKLNINDKTISDIKNISNVENVIPLISVVGHITYKNSQSDSVVYGTLADYLKNSNVKLIKGNIFESNSQTLSYLDFLNSLPIRATYSNSTPTPTQLSQPASTAIPTLDQIDLSNNSDSSNSKINIIPFNKSTIREAVVNTSMLTQLNIAVNDAVGTSFDVYFKIPKNLLDNDSNTQSEKISYKIIGVISDDTSPQFYIPFIDLRSLGINTYSQLKVIVNSENNLQQVRDKISVLGYITNSAADTKNQVNNLFNIIRIGLFFIGMIGLSISALGMFNTLTVSLLERTREIGLMKAMGMKSDEITTLFLTESMILGLLGGTFGLIIGYVTGQILNIGVYLIFIKQLPNVVSLTSIPGYFVLFIFILSLIIGVVTGIFPATRTKKISVLDTLRYE